MKKFKEFSIKKKVFIVVIVLVFIIVLSGFLIKVKVVMDGYEAAGNCPLCELSEYRTEEITLWDRIFNYSDWFDNTIHNRDDCQLCFIFRGE